MNVTVFILTIIVLIILHYMIKKFNWMPHSEELEVMKRGIVYTPNYNGALLSHSATFKFSLLAHFPQLVQGSKIGEQLI